MPSEPRNATAALLRLRFRALDQLRAHLHVEDNATLLFFRDPGLDLAAGTVALIETVFDTSEETRVVRTTVLARAESAGLWLAMPNARFAREVKERGLVPRKGRRVGADRLLRIRCESDCEHMVNMLDVSLAGARIGGGVPATLYQGGNVHVRLASTEPGETAEIGHARVVWTESGEAGLEFDRTKPGCRAAVAKLFQATEARWRAAREVRHPETCCRGGALLEPPVPRVRVDGKRTTVAPK
jgi:hypothetical protein